MPDTLHRLVASLPEPAYITGRRCDILAWSDAAAVLLGDLGRLDPEARNILHWMITDRAARSRFGASWADKARRMMSPSRPACDLWSGDAAFAGLVDQWRASRPEFAGWWAAHCIAARGTGTKHLNHPALGCPPP